MVAIEWFADWRFRPTGGHLPTRYDFGMGSRFRPNRLDVLAVAAVAITSKLFLRHALDAADLYTSVRTMSGWEQAAGCFGRLVATLSPILASVSFWRWSKRLHKAWILHLLMLPLAYALLWAGASLMLAVIDVPDFDDTIGGPVIQAGILFGLAMVGYYSAVFYTLFLKRPKPANGS